jgi:hypothetical protein
VTGGFGIAEALGDVTDALQNARRWWTCVVELEYVNARTTRRLGRSRH